MSLNTFTPEKRTKRYQLSTKQAQAVERPAQHRFRIIKEVHEVHRTTASTRNVVRVVIAACKTLEENYEVEVEDDTQTPKTISKFRMIRNKLRKKFWNSEKGKKFNVKHVSKVSLVRSVSPTPITFPSSIEGGETEESNSIMQTFTSSTEKSYSQGAECCNPYQKLLRTTESTQNRPETWSSGHIATRCEHSFSEESGPLSSSTVEKGSITTLQRDERPCQNLDGSEKHGKRNSQGFTGNALAAAREKLSQAILFLNPINGHKPEGASELLETTVSKNQPDEASCQPNIVTNNESCGQQQEAMSESGPEVDQNALSDTTEEDGGINREVTSKMPAEFYFGKGTSSSNPLRNDVTQALQPEESKRMVDANYLITLQNKTLCTDESARCEQSVDDENSVMKKVTINPLRVSSLPIDDAQDVFDDNEFTNAIESNSKEMKEMDRVFQIDDDEVTENGVEVDLTVITSPTRSAAIHPGSRSDTNDTPSSEIGQSKMQDTTALDDHLPSSGRVPCLATNEISSERYAAQPERMISETETKEESLPVISLIVHTVEKLGVRPQVQRRRLEADEGFQLTQREEFGSLDTQSQPSAEGVTKTFPQLKLFANENKEGMLVEGVKLQDCKRENDQESGSNREFLHVRKTDATNVIVKLQNADNVKRIPELNNDDFRKESTQEARKLELFHSGTFGSGIEFTESQNEEILRHLNTGAAMATTEGARFKLLAAIGRLVKKMKHDMQSPSERKTVAREALQFDRPANKGMGDHSMGSLAQVQGTENGLIPQLSAHTQLSTNPEIELDSPFALDMVVEIESRDDDDALEDESNKSQTINRGGAAERRTQVAEQLDATDNSLFPTMQGKHDVLTDSDLRTMGKDDVVEPPVSITATSKSPTIEMQTRQFLMNDGSSDGGQTDFFTEKWVYLKQNPFSRTPNGSDASSFDVRHRKRHNPVSNGSDVSLPVRIVNGSGNEKFGESMKLPKSCIENGAVNDTQLRPLPLTKQQGLLKTLTAKHSFGGSQHAGSDISSPFERQEHDNSTVGCSAVLSSDFLLPERETEAEGKHNRSIFGQRLLFLTMPSIRRRRDQSAKIQRSARRFELRQSSLTNLDQCAVQSDEIVLLGNSVMGYGEPSPSASDGRQFEQEHRGLIKMGPRQGKDFVCDRLPPRSAGLKDEIRGYYRSWKARKSKNVIEPNICVEPTLKREQSKSFISSSPFIASDGIEVTYLTETSLSGENQQSTKPSALITWARPLTPSSGHLLPWRAVFPKTNQ
jgi:hypothetical protein